MITSCSIDYCLHLLSLGLGVCCSLYIASLGNLTAYLQQWQRNGTFSHFSLLLRFSPSVIFIPCAYHIFSHAGHCVFSTTSWKFQLEPRIAWQKGLDVLPFTCSMEMAFVKMKVPLNVEILVIQGSTILSVWELIFFLSENPYVGFPSCILLMKIYLETGQYTRCLSCVYSFWICI